MTSFVTNFSKPPKTNAIVHRVCTYRITLHVALFIIFTDKPSEQYERFILHPMRSLTGVGLLVNVIDAFDECNKRKEILNVLAKGEFPDNIRFIITTRAEQDIMKSLRDKPHVLMLDLNAMGAGTIFGDIKTYAHHRLDRHMFTDMEIDQFVSKAGALFQWAATACSYICNDDEQAGVDPRECFMDIMLKGSDLWCSICTKIIYHVMCVR